MTGETTPRKCGKIAHTDAGPADWNRVHDAGWVESSVVQSMGVRAVGTCPATQEMSAATVVVEPSAPQDAVHALRAALAAVLMRGPSGIHWAILKLAPHLGSPCPNDATIRAIKASLVKTLWPREFATDAALCAAYRVPLQCYNTFHCKIKPLAVEFIKTPAEGSSEQSVSASTHHQLFIDPSD